MKHLLLVSYYFPPAAGPGVQRPLRLATYLPEAGWKVTVLTVDPAYAAWPSTDAALLDRVPPVVDVLSTRARSPYRLYARLTGRDMRDVVGVGFEASDTRTVSSRLGRWIRANLFLPDARRGWVPFAVKAGIEAHMTEAFDAVLTTGPPHSSHEIGRLMSRRVHIPWVADFRDGWPDPNYEELLPMTDVARQRDERLRRRVLSEADKVIAVSNRLADRLGTQGATSVKTVRNGYDPDDFAGLNRESSPGFRIVHTGTLRADCAALFEAMAESPHLHLDLIGRVDEAVLEAADRAGVRDRVRTESLMPHREALRRMLGADVLLLAINRVPGARDIATGKIFEYIGAGRPILGIGPVDGEAAAILEESGAGRMFDYDDANGIRHWLSAPPEPGEVDTVPYTRRRMAERVGAVLDAVVASNRNS